VTEARDKIAGVISVFEMNSLCDTIQMFCLLSITSVWFAFSALTLLVGRQEGHPACKKQWWSAGVVICLERDADLHTAQLMPLPLTVVCFSKIQIGFTFLVPAHPGSPGKRAVKRVFCFLLVYGCELPCHGNCCMLMTWQ